MMRRAREIFRVTMIMMEMIMRRKSSMRLLIYM